MFPQLITIQAEILAQAIWLWSCTIDSRSGGWNSARRDFLSQTKGSSHSPGRGKGSRRPVFPCPAARPGAVTPRLTRQMGRPKSPKRPIYCLSLSACVKEGENWAVVNLMFPGNQVILCSRSLKGNSCFPAPLPSCSRGHPALCLLQLLALAAVESEDGYSFSAFLQMLWGRARNHKKGASLVVCNR